MLEVYNAPIAKYKGKGKVLLQEGGHIEGAFRCFQLNTSQVYIEITDGKIVNQVKLSRNEPRYFFEVKKFVGVLADGREIESDSHGIINTRISSEHISTKDQTRYVLTLLLQAQFIKITSPNYESKPIKLIRFALTNYDLNSDGTLGFEWDFELESEKVRIFSQKDFSKIVTIMRANSSATFSAFLEIQGSKKSFNELIETGNNLCSLLTFLNGVKISWIYFELVDAKDNVFYTLHNRTLTMNYSSAFPLIDQALTPDDYFDFIPKAYHNYLQIKDVYNLEDIFNVIAQSKTFGLAKLAALNVSSTVDVLRAKWASQNDLKNILDENFFNDELKKSFENEITKVLKEKGVDKVARGKIKEKIRELNRPSFKSVLRQMVKVFQADIYCTDDSDSKTKDEVTKFVDMRDHLVHEGEFDDPESLTELLEILSFADRLIMAMLGYKGSYWDYRSGRVVSKIPTI